MKRTGVVVHGHRDGNAIGGRPWISEECIARLRVAERVVERHDVTAVLFCGAGAAQFPSEARQMAMAWRGPQADLWLDEHSVDTAENAQQALEWSKLMNLNHLLVVSSWWHIRLALYYRPLRALGVMVDQVRTHRWDHVRAHLVHELRYLPRALRSCDKLDPPRGTFTPAPGPAQPGHPHPATHRKGGRATTA